MKYFLSLVFIYLVYCSVGQTNNVLTNKKYFDEGLQSWTKSSSNFTLSEFEITDTLKFDNNEEQGFKTYKKKSFYLYAYLIYNTDSSKFIDIYSYQLNLARNGKYYFANPYIDQAIYLCDPKKKYWNRIYFTTSGTEQIEEVIWISRTKFILTGITACKMNVGA